MNTPKPLTSEPALSIGAAVALVGAVVVLLRSFGVPITEDQSDAIQQVFLIGSPIVMALLVRRQVWSPQSLADVMPVHEGAGPAPEDVLEAREPGKYRADV